MVTFPKLFGFKIAGVLKNYELRMGELSQCFKHFSALPILVIKTNYFPKEYSMRSNLSLSVTAMLTVISMSSISAASSAPRYTVECSMSVDPDRYSSDEPDGTAQKTFTVYLDEDGNKVDKNGKIVLPYPIAELSGVSVSLTPNLWDSDQIHELKLGLHGGKASAEAIFSGRSGTVTLVTGVRESTVSCYMER
jgi:hypothetical protein